MAASYGRSGGREQLVACQPTPEEYRGLAQHIRRKVEPMSNSGAREDGRVLVFAFCGCSTDEVMSALGLKLGDLFDKPLSQHLPPVRGGFSACELLELLNFEIIVASLIVTDATQGPLKPEATDRLIQASARISKGLVLLDG